jgi:hypothetical protein
MKTQHHIFFLVVLIAGLSRAAGIRQVCSWDLKVTESIAFCKSARTGNLFVYGDGPLVFNGTWFTRAKPRGTLQIDHNILPPGLLDTNFFVTRGTLRQAVYALLTATGATYQLYNVKPEPVTTPVGQFTVPALLSFGVTWFSDGAGSLEVLAIDGSNITLRVRTYGRVFQPLLDQQVVAHLQYTSSAAPAADGIVVSALAVFVQNGKYLRVLNGTDPVSGVPRFNFYRITRTALTPVVAPSLLAKLLGDGVGPFTYPVCKDGCFYVYDKTAVKTIAGPFAIPGTTSNDVTGASWVFAKPVQKLWISLLFPSIGTITPAADIIVLGVTSADGYSLRSYRVTTAGAHAITRTTGYAGMAACNLYGSSFMLVQTNGTGSTVYKIAAGGLRERGRQACVSATPMVSPDRFIVDDAVQALQHMVTIYSF